MKYWLLVVLLCMASVLSVSAKKIHNRHFRFKLTIPEGMAPVFDTGSGLEGLYYDSTVGVVLMISGRESRFTSVKDYIDCTREELEQNLREAYGDSTLTLISCNRFAYYSEKTTVIHFRVATQPAGSNAYLIYFIHHRKKDIQFSFTYKMQAGQNNAGYIDGVMQTIKLK